MATQHFIDSYHHLNWKPYDRNAIGLFGHLGTFLAHVQLAVDLDWQALFF